VAAQAIVHQHSFRVVLGIGKYLAIRDAVRARMPACVFMLVARFAARRHRGHIHIPQLDGLRNGAEDVNPHVAQLCAQAGLVAFHAACCPVGCCMHHLHVSSHLVTARAALAVLRRVVVGRTISAADSEHNCQPNSDPREFEESHHDRNPVPFQLRTNESEAK
jgi:hypothetical protein